MDINVLKMEEKLKKMDKLYEEIENIYINIYNEIKNISNYWDGEKSKFFLNNVLTEKEKIKLSINNISDIKKIYIYIVNNYKKIGNTIHYNLDKKDKILSKIDDYNNRLKKINSIYDSIELNYYKEEASLIIFYKNKLNEIIINLIEIKKNIIDKYNTLERIEKEISRSINNTNIDVLKENNIINYI